MATLIAVDDDLDLLRLIRIALEKDGHRVLTFANPEAVGENDWAQADLILLDVMMPQQSGFELCQKIRGRLSCPILFLSARSEEEMMIEGLGYGADDYLTKPFSLSVLRSRCLLYTSSASLSLHKLNGSSRRSDRPEDRHKLHVRP